MHHFEEEAHYFFGIHMSCELVDQYGDRYWADMEKHRPDVYESVKAYIANREIEDYLEKQYKEKMNDDCDYWKDEKND